MFFLSLLLWSKKKWYLCGKTLKNSYICKFYKPKFNAMVKNEEESRDVNEQPLQEVVDFSDEASQLAAAELSLDDNDAIDDADSLSAPSAYDNLPRAALIEKLSELLKEKPVQELKGEVEAVKVAFYKKLTQEREAQLQKFIDEGGEREAFAAPDDGLEATLKTLFAQYKKMRAVLAAKMEKEREDNLAKKQVIIAELQQLFERHDDFNKVFNEFKDLQARWRTIGAVPIIKQKEVWDVYNYNVEKFYDVVKINRELRELDFKKNFELKQLLCEKTEELLLEPDVVVAFRKLQKYHEQWREIGPVAAEFREPLWERFKNATTQINKKHQDYFEQLKTEQQNNLNLKSCLCEKVEELANSVCTTVKEWNEKTGELQEVQKMWKSIGAAPRKENLKVFLAFRKSCNTFFDNRRAFFKEQKSEYTHNLQQKLELCVQAEALAESSEWKKTSDELVKLQARWKEIGAVPHKQSDVVWKRFRTACNKFFDRKKQHFSTQGAAYDENLKKKEELIAEIKSFTAGENPADNLASIKNFQQRWVEIGYVPMKAKERVQNEYRAAIDALFNALRVSDTERQVMSFKSRVANAAKGDKRQLSSERDKLIQQVKRLEADIQLWENNIGFFAKSKNAEKMIQDVKNNIEKARREMAAALEKIKVLENG